MLSVLFSSWSVESEAADRGSQAALAAPGGFAFEPRIMRKLVITGRLRALGGASTLAMAACVAGMIAGWVS